MSEIRDLLQLFDMRVFPEAKIGGRNTSFGRNRGCFGHDEGRTSDSAAAEVDHVPVVRKTVDAGVLAHWRYDNAVGKRKRAESIRGEKVSDVGHGAVLIDVAARSEVAPEAPARGRGIGFTGYAGRSASSPFSCLSFRC